MRPLWSPLYRIGGFWNSTTRVHNWGYNHLNLFIFSSPLRRALNGGEVGSSHQQPRSQEELSRLSMRSGAATKRANIRRRITPTTQGELVSDQKAPIGTVIAVRTAKVYDMMRLYDFLQGLFPHSSMLQPDVLHVRMPQKTSDSSVFIPQVFFFSEGCFVLWSSPTDATTLLLRLKEAVQPFETDSLAVSETETLSFQQTITDRHYAGMRGELILLEQDSASSNSIGAEGNANTRAKLAFSNGLVDSITLATLENALEEHIERVRPIPLSLAAGQKLAVGRAEVLRLTGELLRFRAELNLDSELIDTPDMYWSEPQLEELYRRVSRVLDIRQRVHILNKKLDYANELAAVLRSHLGEQHGLKLEWGIIVLIAVEVAFATLHWVVELSK